MSWVPPHTVFLGWQKEWLMQHQKLKAWTAARMGERMDMRVCHTQWIHIEKCSGYYGVISPKPLLYYLVGPFLVVFTDLHLSAKDSLIAQEAYALIIIQLLTNRLILTPCMAMKQCHHNISWRNFGLQKPSWGKETFPPCPLMAFWDYLNLHQWYHWHKPT